ncbi:MAG: indole-3-glycerol phosphate synthase TrpC [Actinomycetaceae bacterium]|nr:indole-3-glycerol phosphate synthase TrpC [Actinomycetaceae bacterium]
MNVLDTILQGVHRDLAQREAHTSMDDLKRRCHQIDDAKDVIAALRSGPNYVNDESRGAVSVIAEVKRASPSKGFLADIPEPGELAQEYEKGGASVVSVLTERHRFHGSLDDLDVVRAAVDIPILRKDFIVTPYQVHEARAHGADMVLLMVVCLEQPALVSLVERVHSLGMTALVEAHSRLEALRALDAGARVVGINARDLRTLEVNMDNFAQIVDVIPEDVIAVAESGVKTPHDVFDYAQDGADAVLIGEALVKNAQPREAVAEMVSAGQHPALATSRRKRISTDR